MIQTQSAPASAQALAGATLAAAPSHHPRSPEPPQAASPAGKVKYADPRSLPCYPSSGLRPGGAVASAAATLGRTSHPREPVEMRRLDSAASASAAAVFAKDIKMTPIREPTPDDAGSRAAILAAESADAALNKPHNDDDGWHGDMGDTAANQAFIAERPLSPESGSLLREGTAAAQASYTDHAQSNEAEPPPAAIDDGSLAAAIGAMSNTKQATADSSQDTKTVRQRSGSVDAPTASANAYHGATAAHRESLRALPLENPGAVSVTTMTREMFTSYPPVKPETDERDEDQRRHQSAVEMAKRMYRQQQEQRQELGQTADTSGDSSVILANPHVNLQDAAYRQAQERLAKLQDEHQKNQEYKNYYTKDLDSGQAQHHRRLSFIAKLRRQSEDDSRADARRRERRTRQEMPFFSTKPSPAESAERERAREALLAAAHRNVKAQLQNMDNQAAQDARKANPIHESALEGVRQHRAHALPLLRVRPQDDRKGKVDIGGGRFMDASEIDAIAARRVRPIMDDLNRSVAAERDRMDTLRREEEHRRDELRRQKSRERERKEMDRRFRDEDKENAKARKLQAKQDAKARKEEAKVAKAERKRQVKEQKQRRKQNQVGGQRSEGVGADQGRQEGSGPGVTNANANEGDTGPGAGSRAEETTAGAGQGAATQGRRVSHQESRRQSQQGSAREPRRQSTLDSTQGSTRHSQQDSARESRFSSIGNSQQSGRRASNPGSNPGSSSKGSSSPINKVAGWFKSRLSRKKASGKESKEEERPKGFIGGAALRSSGDHAPGKATGSQEPSHRARGEECHRETTSEAGPYSGSHEDLEAPRQLANASTDQVSGSPARDSRFREIIDQ